MQLVCGTKAGELAVFSCKDRVFRACVPVSCGGLNTIEAIQTQTDEVLVYCGCGDGKVKVLRGQDQTWQMESEREFPFSITGLSMNADNSEVMITTSEGDVYRLAPRRGHVARCEGVMPVVLHEWACHERCVCHARDERLLRLRERCGSSRVL